MPYWAVYDLVTGELKSHGTKVADPLPTGWVTKDVASPPGGDIWDPVLKQFNARPDETMILMAAFEAHPDFGGWNTTNRSKFRNIVNAVLDAKCGMDPSTTRVAK